MCQDNRKEGCGLPIPMGKERYVSGYMYLQEFMRAMRLSNPTMRALADQMEREEVVRWANSLSRARVTRWGGMISTPDDVLQVRPV